MLNFDADDGHVRQRMVERNISQGDAEWVVAGGVYEIQSNGRRKYVRSRGANRYFVITEANGIDVVTLWIRGPADTGVR
jgi:hypothetical protein